jgi:hypothetical protein
MAEHGREEYDDDDDGRKRPLRLDGAEVPRLELTGTPHKPFSQLLQGVMCGVWECIMTHRNMPRAF